VVFERSISDPHRNQRINHQRIISLYISVCCSLLSSFLVPVAHLALEVAVTTYGHKEQAALPRESVAARERRAAAAAAAAV
jgi:hypothetical protein